MNNITRDNIIDIASYLEVPSRDSYNFMLACRDFRAIINDHFTSGWLIKEIKVPKFVSPGTKTRNVVWNYQYLLLGRKDIILQNKVAYFKAFISDQQNKIFIVTKNEVIVRDIIYVAMSNSSKVRPTGYHFQIIDDLECYPVHNFVPTSDNIKGPITLSNGIIKFITWQYTVRKNVDTHLPVTKSMAFDNWSAKK